MQQQADIQNQFNSSESRMNREPFRDEIVVAFFRDVPQFLRLLQRHPHWLAPLDEVLGGSALLSAALRGQTLVVRELLHHGANVHFVHIKGSSTILTRVALTGHPDVIRELFRHGANPHDEDNASIPSFHLACWNGNVEVIKAFLDAGVDPNHADGEGNAVLFENRNLECVALLLQQKTFNVHQRNHKGQTPLMMTYGDCVESARMLIESGLDVNAQDNDGNTALSNAIRRGHVQLAKLLLERGANIHLARKDGITPVLEACDILQQQPDFMYVMLRTNPNLYSRLGCMLRSSKKRLAAKRNTPERNAKRRRIDA